MCRISYTQRPRTDAVVWKKPGLDLYTDLREAPKRQEITLRAPMLVATILGMSPFWGCHSTTRTLVLAMPFWDSPYRLFAPGAYLHTSKLAAVLWPNQGHADSLMGSRSQPPAWLQPLCRAQSYSQPGQEPGICLPVCPQYSSHHNRRSHMVHIGGTLRTYSSEIGGEQATGPYRMSII